MYHLINQLGPNDRRKFYTMIEKQVDPYASNQETQLLLFQ